MIGFAIIFTLTYFCVPSLLCMNIEALCVVVCRKLIRSSALIAVLSHLWVLVLLLFHCFVTVNITICVAWDILMPLFAYWYCQIIIRFFVHIWCNLNRKGSLQQWHVTGMCKLQMTRIVLPQMLERKKGAIINISSLSGAIPTPLLTVYSGTKVITVTVS